MRSSIHADRSDDRGPIILLYHSVGKARVDPWGLRVEPRNFSAHMRVLRERANPVRLKEIGAGELPPRSVAVTFDDGYADTLHAAAPILNQWGVPATVFIATAYVGGDAEYWWDDLERIVLSPAASVRGLAATINGTPRQWPLVESLSDRLMRSRRLPRWRAWQTERLTKRQSTLLDLWRILRELEPDARDALLVELRSQAGHDRVPRQTHRPLTRAELHELAANSAIEIGAHTHRHPSLAMLNPSSQQEEIERSKRWLETELQRPVTSFALPFGTAADYDRATLDIVRRAGFARCVTTRAAAVGGDASPLALPRFNVSDWSGDEFAQRLEQWFASPSEVRPASGSRPPACEAAAI